MIMADITGIGWVTAAGMGCGRDNSRFAMTRGPLPKIRPDEIMKDPYPSFRRLDGFSRLGVTAIALALQDARLEAWTEERNIGIIASSVYGCFQTDVDFYDTVISSRGQASSPALFSYTLPNSFLGEAAIRFGLTGVGFVISEPHPAGRICLQAALDHLVGGYPQKLLAGVCDLDCLPALAAPENPQPGALFFMMENCPSNESLSYGKLALSSNGTLFFDGREIQNCYDLVQKCLAGQRDI